MDRNEHQRVLPAQATYVDSPTTCISLLTKVCVCTQAVLIFLVKHTGLCSGRGHHRTPAACVCYPSEHHAEAAQRYILKQYASSHSSRHLPIVQKHSSSDSENMYLILEQHTSSYSNKALVYNLAENQCSQKFEQITYEDVHCLNIGEGSPCLVLL